MGAAGQQSLEWPSIMAARRDQQRMFAPLWRPKTSTLAQPQFHTGPTPERTTRRAKTPASGRRCA
jgi:hypothetical protein